MFIWFLNFRLEVSAHSFKVADAHGNNLFSVNQNAVTIGAHALKVEGDGGVIFKDSIQTPLIRAEAGKDLRYYFDIFNNR